MTNNAERENFESYVKGWPNYSDRMLVRDGRYPEYYGNPVVQGAWGGWKARGAWEGWKAARAHASGSPDSELVQRFRVAFRALISDREVTGEDVDTLIDVLRVLEGLPKVASVPVERLETLHTRFDNAEWEERASSGEYSSGKAAAFSTCARDLAELIAEYKAETTSKGE